MSTSQATWSANVPSSERNLVASIDAKLPSGALAANRHVAPSAVVYCEANFGAIDGKTANGLVRHSERYRIVSVIDSEKAGLDSGVVLGGEPNGIPIYRNLEKHFDAPKQSQTSLFLEWHRQVECFRPTSGACC